MRSRRHLVIENLPLRQQIATLAGRRHPDIRPATAMRWHRAGFRIYWNWLCRRGRRSGRPPRTPRANAPRTTFLRNHRDGIAAMDFFTVPTAMFRVLHVFLVIRHDPVDAHGANAHQLGARRRRRGPEVPLGHAAGSIGRGSGARWPVATSILASGDTIEAPSPSSGALLHPASDAALFTDRVLANDSLILASRPISVRVGPSGARAHASRPWFPSRNGRPCGTAGPYRRCRTRGRGAPPGSPSPGSRASGGSAP